MVKMAGERTGLDHIDPWPWPCSSYSSRQRENNNKSVRGKIDKELHICCLKLEICTTSRKKIYFDILELIQSFAFPLIFLTF